MIEEIIKLFDVPSYLGRLKINKNGDVYSLISNKFLKKNYLPTGYVIIVLMLKNPRRCKTLYLHRLLAETFIPNLENKKTINHKDGNKKNNCIDNLEWATQSENNKHAIKNLLRIPNYEKILLINKSKRKFSEEQVKFIRDNKNLKPRYIMKYLNINCDPSIIYDIRNKKTYKEYN